MLRQSFVSAYVNPELLLIGTNILAGRKVDPAILANEINQPNLVMLIRRFLYEQHHPNLQSSLAGVSEHLLPALYGERLAICASAVATFHAPSDICGTGGMSYERIRAVPSWRHGPARYDCVFIETDPTADGMAGLDIARARLFFSFTFRGTLYPCALVEWFSRVGDEPDEDTGMWMVEPDDSPDQDGAPSRHVSVVHLDSILRAAHLLAVYGNKPVPAGLSFTQTLDIFRAYYVNKYIDHHSYEIAF